jgi:hypothetical protein
MTRFKARLLTLVLVIGSGMAAFIGFHSEALPLTSVALPAQAEDKSARPVYLATGLSSENVIALSANVAASAEPGIVLLDAPKSRAYLNAFLKAYHPAKLIAVGASAESLEGLERSPEGKVSSSASWKDGLPADLGKALFPRAKEIVVCAAKPRRLLLQAACLAGAARAPLLVLAGQPEPELKRWTANWQTRKIYAVGDQVAQVCQNLGKVEVEPVPNDEAAATTAVRLLAKSGPIETLVLANPADADAEQMGMSSLAPWIALEHHSALLLTNDKGTDAADLIRAALKNPELRKVENVIFAADLQAIPMERRADPLPGKDPFIPVEPPAPDEKEPFTFATGRLFHEEPGVVALMLARRHLLARANGPRKALIVSNPGGGLPLLETISRHTANELRNTGYQTTALFQREANKAAVHRLLPEQDIFLWEGHLATLIDNYGVPFGVEPLPPALVFLQSCLALTEREAQPFLRRGAVAVVGSPSRTYSATGGAVTLAFFNAVAYDQQSLGGALRQAKNFLLAFARLKEQRLKSSGKLNGASVRSAWAFTLWGDPTLKLPAPQPPPDALAAVRPVVDDKRIAFRLPGAAYQEVTTEKYAARLWPNGRLAGYLTKAIEEDRQRLLPLLFAEVSLPKGGDQKTPRLRSKLADDRWVFIWDARRRAGYLLALPGAKDRQEIHFDIEWRDAP